MEWSEDGSHIFLRGVVDDVGTLRELSLTKGRVVLGVGGKNVIVINVPHIIRVPLGIGG